MADRLRPDVVYNVVFLPYWSSDFKNTQVKYKKDEALVDFIESVNLSMRAKGKVSHPILSLFSHSLIFTAELP